MTGGGTDAVVFWDRGTPLLQSCLLPGDTVAPITDRRGAIGTVGGDPNGTIAIHSRRSSVAAPVPVDRRCVR